MDGNFAVVETEAHESNSLQDLNSGHSNLLLTIEQVEKASFHFLGAVVSHENGHFVIGTKLHESGWTGCYLRETCLQQPVVFLVHFQVVDCCLTLTVSIVDLSE